MSDRKIICMQCVPIYLYSSYILLKFQNLSLIAILFLLVSN